MKRLLLSTLTVLLVTASLAQAQRMPVTTSSDAARAQYELGLHEAVHNNIDAARLRMDAALAADPSFAMAHMYRAFLSGGDTRAEHMRQATALGARASKAEQNEIAAYAANLSDDRDREVALHTETARQFPADPVPVYWIATGEADAAARIAAAQRVLTVDPSFAPAYNVIGYVEMAQGNTTAAERAFREQIRLAPDEPNPYDSYGEFLMNQGKLDEAEAQYEMALTKDPSFENASTMLARVGIQRTSRRFEQALAAGDADAIAALYIPNAIALPPGGPTLVGRDAIRADMVAVIASGIKDVELETLEVRRFGDNAIVRNAITIREDGEVVQTGKSLTVWTLRDGEWLYARDMWNWDAPTN